MLTPEQHATFEERGWVRLPAAFAREDAADMEAAVWAFLERKFGAHRDRPETWNFGLASGLQSLKRRAVFQAIGGAATVGALDDLLGPGRWIPPRDWGQFLITFPTGNGEWTVPSRVWHTDFGYLPSGDELFGLLMFSFLSDVPAQAGGTLIVEGSHRLVTRVLGGRPSLKKIRMKQARKALLASDPWLRALSSKDDGAAGDRVERFVRQQHVIGDIPVRVAELTGQAGDVIVGHPWLLHAGSPCCTPQPRIMRVQRIRTRTEDA